MKLFSVLLFTSLVISCTVKKNKNNNPKKEIGASLATPTSTLDEFVLDYLALKDAFVKNDTTGIAAAGQKLKITAEKLKTDTFNKNSYATVINQLYTNVNLLADKINVSEKLSVFKDITKPLQNILTTESRYTLYVQNCPMANDYSTDKNVYWLSKDKRIHNPFYPQTMPNCGRIVDTITIKK